jgi:regulator of protease activity HflC (stomatin/prohibitin superfamily)
MVGCVSWFTILASITASALIIVWGLTPRLSKRRNWFLVGSLLLAFVALTTTVLSAGLVFIMPDERGVVISAVDGEVRPEPLQPGLNWTVPYLEKVITYPITRQIYSMTAVPREGQYVEDDLIPAHTAEGDTRYVGCTVLYSIDPNRVVDVHILWLDRYEDNLVRPVVRGGVRDILLQYRTAIVDSDDLTTIEEHIHAEVSPMLQEGGIHLYFIRLTEVLDDQEYSALLEERRSEESEEEDITATRENNLVGVQHALQTVVCLAFPAMVLVAGVLNARRKATVSEPSAASTKDEVSDTAQGIGMEVLKASSPEEYYLLGKALLERGEQSQAIEAFTEAYRTSEDPSLKKKALERLEGLGAVKGL